MPGAIINLRMPNEQAYLTELPWDPARPEAVVITCVDGRWYRHFQEFAREHLKAGPCTDFMAVPGGIEPMTLADEVPKDFNFFRRRLEALVEAHGTRRIVVIAHQDCAWYRDRMGGATAEAMRAKQVADMRRAASWLRTRFEGIVVQPFFARLSGSKPENGREGLKKYDPEAFALMDDFYSGRIDIDKVEPRRRRTNTNSVESARSFNSNQVTNSPSLR